MADEIKLRMTRERFVMLCTQYGKLDDALKEIHAALIEEPLPCPFCGGLADITYSAEHLGWKIRCLDCGANMYNNSILSRPLVAAWNRRAK